MKYSTNDNEQESPQENSVFTFPCEFPIKILGRNQERFEIEALSIIRKHFDNIKETAIELKTSKNDKYLSLTVTVLVESQKQLDTVYQALSDNEHIITVL